MDQNLKRSIILENYQNPKNRGLTGDNSYIKVNSNSDSCIDEIDLEVKIVDGKIEDIRFDGEACAICTSATSIMIDTLIGKDLKEAKEVYDHYNKMIEEKNYDPEKLNCAIVYDDICKQPNRKKCALIPWWGIEKAFLIYENNPKLEK